MPNGRSRANSHFKEGRGGDQMELATPTVIVVLVVVIAFVLFQGDVAGGRAQ